MSLYQRCPVFLSTLLFAILILGSVAISSAHVTGEAEDRATTGTIMGPGMMMGTTSQSPTTKGDAVPARILAFAGRFHPLMVHFPIALLIAAALAEFLNLFISGHGLAYTARHTLWLAAGSAVVASILGWVLAADGSSYDDQLLLWHRWLGTLTAAIAVLALVVGELARKPGRERFVVAYRVLLLVGVALVSVTGHLGASMVYGSGYFNFS